MPEITIRLIPDPTTGKKNIIISMRGDEDAMPHEHEEMHRGVVNKILERGLIKETELGNITVERVPDEKAPPAPAGAQPEQQRQAQKQGGK